MTPGEHIVALCKTYNIDRKTLSERSGLNVELIERIESGTIPDLAPLLKISRALGVRLGTLLDDHEALGPVITRAGAAGESERFVTGRPDHPVGTSSHPGLSFKALAADKSGRHMEPFIVDIDPAAEQSKSTHEGEEFIYILSGQLLLEYGQDSRTLDTGDSVFYDSIAASGGFPQFAYRIRAQIPTPDSD
ncbi:XRE family transcriptional regulator [Spirochaetia bacterium]|nr:XRE family transcriptional regulator [Spirochaetia bacterium]